MDTISPWIITMVSVQVLQGQQAILTCPVTTHIPEWHSPFLAQLSQYEQSELPVTGISKDLRSRITLLGNQLLINKTTVTDAGNYTCRYPGKGTGYVFLQVDVPLVVDDPSTTTPSVLKTECCICDDQSNDTTEHCDHQDVCKGSIQYCDFCATAWSYTGQTWKRSRSCMDKKTCLTNIYSTHNDPGCSKCQFTDGTVCYKCCGHDILSIFNCQNNSGGYFGLSGPGNCSASTSTTKTTVAESTDVSLNITTATAPLLSNSTSSAHPKPVYFYQGQDVKINCSISTAIPKWINPDGQVINFEGFNVTNPALPQRHKYSVSESGSLKINETVYSDVGLYTCVSGLKKEEFNLIMNARPSPVTDTVMPTFNSSLTTTVFQLYTPTDSGTSTQTIIGQCEVCSNTYGLYCRTPAVVTCPVSTPYCMNRVISNSLGFKSVEKRCSTQVDCFNKYWSKNNAECLKILNSTKEMDCYFCCSPDFSTITPCNLHVIPPDLSVFYETRAPTTTPTQKTTRNETTTTFPLNFNKTAETTLFIPPESTEQTSTSALTPSNSTNFMDTITSKSSFTNTTVTFNSTTSSVYPKPLNNSFTASSETTNKPSGTSMVTQPISTVQSSTSAYMQSTSTAFPRISTTKGLVSVPVTAFNFSTSSELQPVTTDSESTIQTETTAFITTTKENLTNPVYFTPAPSISGAGNVSTENDTTLSMNLANASSLSSKMPTSLSTGPLLFGTTKKPIATIPPFSTKCAVCAGPPEACEVAFYEDYCQPPNHYCINHITNMADGSRNVERKCGNIENCYNDWYLGTSDDDKCRRFSSSVVMTYNFECTYCCVKDGCNVDLHPKADTLYSNT